MTTFEWATCACVTEYTDDDSADLVRYLRKCPYHSAMPDGDAFGEIKTAHHSKALAIKALRLAVNGSERNPAKLAEETPGQTFKPVPEVSFDNTPGKRRLVISDASLTPAERGRAVAELAKINRGHRVVLGSQSIGSGP